MSSSPLLQLDQRPAIFLLWLRLSTPLCQRLSRNVIREIYAYKCLDDLIPFLHHSHLAVYNLSTSTAYTFPKPPYLSPGAFFCLVTKVLAVVLPYEEPTRSTALLDLMQWQCEELPSCLNYKRRPAAIAIDQVVYTFGGLSSPYPCDSCERLFLMERVWESLPSLSRQCCPTACHYEGWIYLPDTLPFDTMDVYNIPFAQFTTVTVEATLCWAPISFICKGVLTLLGPGKKLVRWNVTGAGRRMEELRTECTAGPGSCSPIQMGKKWFWVEGNSLQLHSFASDSLKVSSRPVCLP